MKKQKKSVLLWIALALLCALIFTGCDELGGNSSGDSSVIKIKSVEFEGDNATVLYEDGYKIELLNLSSSALLYTQEITYSFTTSTDPAKDPNGEGSIEYSTSNRTESVTTSSVETDTNAADQTETDVDKEQPGKEQTDKHDSDTSTKDEGSKIEMNGGQWGVRVMGTYGGKNIYVSTQGDAFHVQTQGQSPSAGSTVGSFSAAVMYANYITVDGKKYECYESRFQEYFATNLLEATVEAEIDGNSVTVILENGFSGMSNLKKVTLPASITQIKSSAFKDCQSLTEIHFLGTLEQWNAVEKDKDWDLNTGVYSVICSNGTVKP